MPGLNSRLNVSEGYEVPLSYRGDRMLKEILGRGTSRSEENLRVRDRSRLLETASVLGETLGSCTPSPIGNPRERDGPSRERASVIEPVSGEPRFPSSSFFLKQKPGPSSFRQSPRRTAPTKLSPSSARHVSHLGRTSPNFPSSPHVPSGDSQPASRADLIRADHLKAQEGYSLEISSRVRGRSRIEGAIPAGRVERQDVTPEPVSVEHDFAGEESEPVEEEFAGGEA